METMLPQISFTTNKGGNLFLVAQFLGLLVDMNLGGEEGCLLLGFLKTHPPICTLRQAPETSARSVA